MEHLLAKEGVAGSIPVSRSERADESALLITKDDAVFIMVLRHGNGYDYYCKLQQTIVY